MAAAVGPSAAGTNGAVSAAHPLAVEAGVGVLRAGGTAADAAIAAQAVLCVVAPEACGIGGDALALVAEPTGTVTAVNGTGCWALAANVNAQCSDGGASVTVPGLSGAWAELSSRYGRLPLSECVAAAIALADDGIQMPAATASAAVEQRRRLLAGGAREWVMATSAPGATVRQPELAEALRGIACHGDAWLRLEPISTAIVAAAQRNGGALRVDDLFAHETPVAEPISTEFAEGRLYVQPPMTQGVLLAMAAHWLNHAKLSLDPLFLDHLGVELSEAVFQHRDHIADGAALLAHSLDVDPVRAARRGGPRAYLHTAGVAAVDADGMVLSSLVSVFDDFGSCVYVPELGITLNNRAGGFTTGANRPRPAHRPVHTLAPALWSGPSERVGLATPGADGQIQTLIQVLCRWRLLGDTLESAITAPRWRSEDNALLIEDNHPHFAALADQGHALERRPAGAGVFGAVVAAGIDHRDGTTRAWSDWRRDVAAGVA